MSVFSLWLSIITFSILTAACFTAWKSAVQKRGIIRLSYASLLTAYDLWLVIYTFILFQNIFVDQISQQAIYLMGGIRTLFTVLIIILYLYLCLSRIRWISRFQLWLLTLIPSVLYLGVIVFRFTSMTIALVSVITLIYSLVLLTVSVLGYTQTREDSLPYLRRLFLITATYQTVMVFLSHPKIFSTDSHLIHVLPRALFCLTVGISEIISFLHPTSAADEGIPELFISRFRITRREQEVLLHIIQGLQVRQIADALFISPRTVETHITNIYTKCDCRNRVELLNLIRETSTT